MWIFFLISLSHATRVEISAAGVNVETGFVDFNSAVLRNIEGLTSSVKETARVRTTSPLDVVTNNGTVFSRTNGSIADAAHFFDNTTLALGDRVLVHQDSVGNGTAGIYLVADAGGARSPWQLRPSNELAPGAIIFVNDGARYAGSGYVVGRDAAIRFLPLAPCPPQVFGSDFLYAEGPEADVPSTIDKWENLTSLAVALHASRTYRVGYSAEWSYSNNGGRKTRSHNLRVIYTHAGIGTVLASKNVEPKENDILAFYLSSGFAYISGVEGSARIYLQHSTNYQASGKTRRPRLEFWRVQ